MLILLAQTFLVLLKTYLKLNYLILNTYLNEIIVKISYS